MRDTQVRFHSIVLLSFVLALSGAALISCGGSSQPTAATTGTANVSMTDPATCTYAFSKVYVTVTKVTANINGNAGPSDSGWQTLVDLTNSPMQVDLLSLANSNTICLLKSLGSSGPLPPGKYQQIRLYLLSNTASGSGTPSSNLCKNNTGWNCVESASNAFSELQLPSQVQTGIKIPSANIVSGGLTITAGQSVDLNIDFQSCASIVHEGNGMYRLKPVLFAGEVTQNMNSISGQVVVGGTSTPIANATVLFEQPQGGTEVIMDSTTTDSNGNFFVCPLPGSANYDIVVAAQTGTLGVASTTYNPTVAFNVPLGTNLGPIPLVPESTSLNATYGGAAGIEGQVDTDAAVPVTLTPTMSLTPAGGSATNVVIPVFGVTGQPPSVTTAVQTNQSPACVSGQDCNNFTLMVPASNASVGTFSSGAITYGSPAAGDIIYSVTAASGDCSSSSATITTPSPGVSADTTTDLTSTPLSLSGCTAPAP